MEENSRIRRLQKEDLAAVMELWLHTNLQAHPFVSEAYWRENFEGVKEALPKAEVFVCERDDTGKIIGFIGMKGQYIAGIFVKKEMQSMGIGKKLLDHVKQSREKLTLHVYQKNQRAVDFYLREGFSIRAEALDENTGKKEFLLEWNG